MNSRQCAKELMLFLRGKRSQQGMDLKFKLSKNQFQRWESGKAKIKWTEFQNLCEKLNIPFKKSLSKSLGLFDDFHWSTIITHTMTGIPRSTFSKRAKISTATLSRWMNCKEEPNLEQMLTIIQLLPGALGCFLSLLTDSVGIPSLKSEIDGRNHELLLHDRYPYAGAAILCLGLQDYLKLPHHQHGFMAQKIGITLKEEEQLLSLFLKTKTIEFTQGKYKILRPQINLAGGRGEAIRIRKYWMQKVINLIDQDPELKKLGTLILPYMTYSCSEKDHHLIQKKILKLYQEINHICNGSEPCENIFIFNLQLLPLTAFV